MKIHPVRCAKSVATFTATALAAVSALITGPSALAAEVEWNVESGDFMLGDNWVGGNVPGGSDDGVISNSGVATVSGGSATMLQLWVGNTAHGTRQGTLVQSGGALTLTTGLVVGRQADAIGTYTMTGGTLDTVDFRIGGGPAGTTSNGTMNVSGPGTVVTITGAVAGVGTAGEGFLTISDSAVVNRTGGVFLVGTDNATSGAAGGTGTVNVQSNAQLNVSGNLAIGRNSGGTGTVVVDGGDVTSGSQINLGVFNGVSSGGTGTLTLNSGTVTGSIVRIMEGSGTVNLNGGILATGSMFRSAANVSATVNFNGGTVRASAESSDFFSGFSSSHLNIQAGGLVFDTNGSTVSFTQGLSGQGALTKTGDGILLINGASTYAGGTLVNGGTLVVLAGDLGTGSITVAENGLLDFDYDFTMTSAGLVLEAGSEFMLDQNLTFAGLSIAGDVFEQGVYDYTTLKASYGNIFLDGGDGQITVVPEPSTLALIGLGAIATLWRLRRRP